MVVLLCLAGLQPITYTCWYCQSTSYLAFSAYKVQQSPCTSQFLPCLLGICQGSWFQLLVVHHLVGTYFWLGCSDSWEAVQPGGSSPGGHDGCNAHQAPVQALQAAGGADERQHRPVQAQGVRREADGQHEGEGGQPVIFVCNLKITERNTSQQN